MGTAKMVGLHAEKQGKEDAVAAKQFKARSDVLSTKASAAAKNAAVLAGVARKEHVAYLHSQRAEGQAKKAVSHDSMTAAALSAKVSRLENSAKKAANMAAEADHVAVLRASHPERDGGYACNRDECITNPNLSGAALRAAKSQLRSVSAPSVHTEKEGAAHALKAVSSQKSLARLHELASSVKGRAAGAHLAPNSAHVSEHSAQLKVASKAVAAKASSAKSTGKMAAAHKVAAHKAAAHKAAAHKAAAQKATAHKAAAHKAVTQPLSLDGFRDEEVSASSVATAALPRAVPASRHAGTFGDQMGMSDAVVPVKV